MPQKWLSHTMHVFMSVQDLDEWHSKRVLFDFALHGVTNTTDELMWNHKEQNVSALGSVEQIWHRHLWAREKRERERNREKGICLMLNDETCGNIHSLNIFTIGLVAPKVTDILPYSAGFWQGLCPFQAKTTLFTLLILRVIVPYLCQWFSRPLAQSWDSDYSYRLNHLADTQPFGLQVIMTETTHAALSASY